MLDARAIAVQGVGYEPLLVATQGFVEREARPDVLPLGYGGKVSKKPSIRRSDDDDDVLILFML